MLNIDVIKNLQSSYHLREQLIKLPIKGIPTVKRAMIRTKPDESGKDIYYIVIEGDGLKDVMATCGVAFQKAISNNVMEVAQVLGIEAAREVIIREIQETMSGQATASHLCEAARYGQKGPISGFSESIIIQGHLLVWARANFDTAAVKLAAIQMESIMSDAKKQNHPAM